MFGENIYIETIIYFIRNFIFLFTPPTFASVHMEIKS